MFEQQLAVAGRAACCSRGAWPIARICRCFGPKTRRVAYLTCDPVEHSHALDPEPGLRLNLAARASEPAVPRWVGLLPYECRRDLERADTWRIARGAAPDRAALAALRRGRRDQRSGRARARRRLATRWQRLPRVCVGQPLAVAWRRRARAARRVRSRGAASRAHSTRARAHPCRRPVSGQSGPALRLSRARLGARACSLGLLERGRPPHAAAFAWGPLDVITVSPELFVKTDTSGAYLHVTHQGYAAARRRTRSAMPS